MIHISGALYYEIKILSHGDWLLEFYEIILHFKNLGYKEIRSLFEIYLRNINVE